MNDNKEIYETGATSHAVNDLILFTDNTKELAEYRDKVLARLSVREETYHDGHNWISKATGNQFHHEKLYHTKSGKFVLNTWSHYHGSKDLFIEISESEAAEWIIKNEFDDLDFLDELPAKVKNSILQEIEAREI